MASITRTSVPTVPSGTTLPAQNIEDLQLSKVAKIFKEFKDTKDMPKIVSYAAQWNARVQPVSLRAPIPGISHDIIPVNEKNKNALESYTKSKK